MGKNDGSGASIYGGVPDPPKDIAGDALASSGELSSNTINGSLKSKDSEYDPENGK
jgi:hypothetical protein